MKNQKEFAMVDMETYLELKKFKEDTLKQDMILCRVTSVSKKPVTLFSVVHYEFATKEEHVAKMVDKINELDDRLKEITNMSTWEFMKWKRENKHADSF